MRYNNPTMTSPTPSTELLIRRASRRDLEAIGNLWVELMTFHAEVDPRFGIPRHGRQNYIRYIYQSLHDHNYCVLVAAVEGRVTGYVIGYIAQNPPIFPHPHYGFIADLCVTSTCRRQGTGRALVEDILQWFKQRGMSSVQLNVAHHNPVSQAFWRKIGCTDYLNHMWMPLELTCQPYKRDCK